MLVNLDTLKGTAFGTLLGGAFFGVLALVGGYSWGSKDLNDLKTRLANQEVKVVTVEKVVKDTVYQDRVQYLDKVKIVKESVPFLVEREVYKNVCLDEDGVRGFNTLMGR